MNELVFPDFPTDPEPLQSTRGGIKYHADLVYPTQKYLRSILHYAPDTGWFTWTNPPKNHTRMQGQQAGATRTGYVMIKIDGQRYKAHRLAWLYVHGIVPGARIDHRDGDPFNNAISNLREATQAENIANARLKSGKVLPKGVRLNGDGYTARISYEKKLITIGTFPTIEAAATAYLNEATRLYGDFARAG